MLVVCDRQPQFKLLPEKSWRFVPWTAEDEVPLVQEMDVGLMPLPNTEWTRGKCALKMLMYLACGIPAVVSPVGVSGEILQNSEVGLAARETNDWFVALSRVYADRELGAQLGAAGRKLVEERFSVQANVPRLAQVIEKIAARP
jgi:glycosyltransferase involved in cell wall biosynthesis